MTSAVFVLLAVAGVGLAWWVLRRAERIRREAEAREARALEALFLARHAADGGAGIDVERIFGGAPVPPPAPADRPANGPATGPVPTGRQTSDCAPQSPVPVRDLVRVFYEARGFRAAPVAASARPVELVLAHKSDPQRAYAFVPLAQAPTSTALHSIIEHARSIGCKRVLIATEDLLAPDTGDALPAHGVRLLDRAAIEAQLAQLDAAVAGRILAAARQRGGPPVDVN